LRASLEDTNAFAISVDLLALGTDGASLEDANAFAISVDLLTLATELWVGNIARDCLGPATSIGLLPICIKLVSI
jgi:hypothetical protein